MSSSTRIEELDEETNEVHQEAQRATTFWHVYKPVIPREAPARPPVPPAVPKADLRAVAPSLVGLPPQLTLPVLTPSGTLSLITVRPESSAQVRSEARQRSLAKYRAKRANRTVRHDNEKSKRAKGQPRDANGAFTSEVSEQQLKQAVAALQEKLRASESIAVALKVQVSTVEQELRQIQQISSPGGSTALPLPSSTSPRASETLPTPDAEQS